MVRAEELRRRRLSDIAELQNKPYPNIRIHVDDQDVSKICLILSPEGWQKLHLTVTFPDSYPLCPPAVTMDSHIRHPNVFGEYICASILNTREGYTPAYTLKGIAIQMLSFFGSDSIEQEYGGRVDLQAYRNDSQPLAVTTCAKCGFLSGPYASTRVSLADLIADPEFYDAPTTPSPDSPGSHEYSNPPSSTVAPRRCFIGRLPNEVLLQVAENLDFEDLTKFAGAWDRVSTLITEFDVVRTRELQCFVLKENYVKRMLGVGVALAGNGRQRALQSEFDLLSRTAYDAFRVTSSIHGIPFAHWLPLPISRGHWSRVKHLAETSLDQIARDARISSTDIVIYAFMNDVMVRLNSDLTRRNEEDDRNVRKSTLRHASEKAIESYFHLFHLLLCLATSKPSIVAEANRMITSFMSGNTSKTDVPNLGYLLIALLISDIDPTETLMKKIVTEAITRNVVWLLDRKGAGMAELGYLESDPVSHYRLKKTFEGSRTSYRLLMFSELFRRTARPSPSKPPVSALPTPVLVDAVAKPQVGSYSAAAARKYAAPPEAASPSRPPMQGRKTLPQLRDELFKRHGGAPPGTAARLAAEVRRLQQIDDFPSFLREMGVTIPGAASFTSVLRGTVKTSTEKGYSRPTDAYVGRLASLRLMRDPIIDRAAVEADLAQRRTVLPPVSRTIRDIDTGVIKFFPGTNGGTPAPSRGNQIPTRGASNMGGQGRGRGRGF